MDYNYQQSNILTMLEYALNKISFNLDYSKIEKIANRLYSK